MEIRKLTTRDIMAGQEMKIFVHGDFRMRTKIACGLLRLASAILTVPVEVTIAPKPYQPERAEDWTA